MRSLWCVACASVAIGPVAALAGGTAAFKQIGAPPEDVLTGRLAPVDPETHGAIGRCGQIIIEGNGGPVDVDLTVPACSHLAIVPIGTSCDDWLLEIRDPSGRPIDAAAMRHRQGRLAPLGHGVASRWDISDPVAGVWIATIHGLDAGQRGVLFVRDDVPAHLRSTLSTYQVLDGHPVQLTARFESTDASRAAPVMLTASMSVDGAREPLDATIAGGAVSAELSLPAGQHLVRVNATGVDPQTQTPVHRTVLHMVHVEGDPPVLDGQVSVKVIDQNRVLLTLACSEVGTRNRVLAGAEVWSGQGLRAWIGGMATLGASGIELVLDTRWLEGHGTDVQLRNVRIADPDSAVTLADATHMQVPDIACRHVVPAPDDRRSMHMGRGDRGGVPIPGADRALEGGHNLMFVHGYCSGGNPWPTSQFSGDLSVYHNPDQNLSNDAFALDILAFGQQFKSFSIAGHSQGGSAGLHLYSFYWSGLDWATPSPQDGGRLVQALGSPLRGTALAGNIAALGEIFGVQCGANYDMTYDGAALWLSYVPTWARQACWSWTTTFTDDWWSWDYCHLAADLVLSDPEDGVVEGFSGDIDGGNYMGLKEGWCHIEDMTDPPQAYDSTRNSEINAEAAR